MPLNYSFCGFGMLVVPLLLSSSDFNEDLLIRPLPNGHALVHFSFLNVNDWQRSNRTLSSYRLFPKPLSQLVEAFDVEELRLTFTSSKDGQWNQVAWGEPPSDGASGVEMWARLRVSGEAEVEKPSSFSWKQGQKSEGQTNVQRRWQGLRSALAGMFCASLNLIDQRNTVQGQGVELPGEVWKTQNTDTDRDTETYYAQLPREVVCTENLTPWLKMLPCRSHAGLGSLLNPRKLFAGDAYSIKLHIWREQAANNASANASFHRLHAEQTFTAVVIPPLAPPPSAEEAIADAEEDAAGHQRAMELELQSHRWSLESLLGWPHGWSDHESSSGGDEGGKGAWSLHRCPLATHSAIHTQVPQLSQVAGQQQQQQQWEDAADAVDYQFLHTPSQVVALPANRFGGGEGGWWLVQHELPDRDGDGGAGLAVSTRGRWLQLQPRNESTRRRSYGEAFLNLLEGGVEAAEAAEATEGHGGVRFSLSTSAVSQTQGRLAIAVHNPSRLCAVSVEVWAAVPSFLRMYMHTLRMRTLTGGAGTSNSTSASANGGAASEATPALSLRLRPALHSGPPALLEGGGELGAQTSIVATVDFDKAFLPIEDHPPDPMRGQDLASAVLEVRGMRCARGGGGSGDDGPTAPAPTPVPAPAPTPAPAPASARWWRARGVGRVLGWRSPFRRDTAAEVGRQQCSDEEVAPLLVYSASPLVMLPLPDFSMPYNVITLTSTIVAFFLGTSLNVLTKKKKPKKKQKKKGLRDKLRACCRRKSNENQNTLTLTLKDKDEGTKKKPDASKPE